MCDDAEGNVRRATMLSPNAEERECIRENALTRGQNRTRRPRCVCSRVSRDLNTEERECIAGKRWRGQSTARRFSLGVPRDANRIGRGATSAFPGRKCIGCGVVLCSAACRRRAARWQPSRREPDGCRGLDDPHLLASCRLLSLHRAADMLGFRFDSVYLGPPFLTKGPRQTSWWGDSGRGPGPTW